MKILTTAVCFILAVGFSGTASMRVAEVYIVADQKLISEYVKYGATSVADAKLKIRADTDYILTQTNKLLKALSVELRVQQFDVLDRDVFDDCEIRNKQRVHEDLSIYAFDKYLQNKTIYAKHHYDLALLFTGYILYGKDNATVGYARVGRVCHEAGVGVIEFTGTYNDAMTIAHEVGHVLGLKHDDDQSAACGNGFVMAAKSSVSSTNRWKFSKCSLSDITSLLKDKTCLKQTSSSSKKPNALPSADMLNMDEICQRWMRNPKSHMCKEDVFYQNSIPVGDIVCKRIFCQKVGTDTCSGSYPTEGMVCAQGKRCSLGKCTIASASNPTPANVDNSCVFGDWASITTNGVSSTCGDWIAKPEDGRHCYQAGVRNACCDTCNKRKISQAGCEYGDKMTITLEGKSLSCAAFITKDKRIQCYRDDILDACCGTCAKWKNSSNPGCEFGDKSTLCTDYSRDQICPKNQDMCCEYCRGFKGKRSAILGRLAAGVRVQADGPNPQVTVVEDTVQIQTPTNTAEIDTRSDDVAMPAEE